MAEGHQDFPFTISLQNGRKIEPTLVPALSSDRVQVYVAEVEESLIRNLQVRLRGVPGLKVAVYSRVRSVKIPESGECFFQPVILAEKELGRKYGAAGVFASLWLHATHEGTEYSVQVVYGAGQRIDAFLKLGKRPRRSNS